MTSANNTYAINHKSEKSECNLNPKLNHPNLPSVLSYGTLAP